MRIRSNWAYRVVGPFALPKYADGGYSAALSIAFFRDILASESNDKVLWSQGLNFVLSNNNSYEIDFILLFQQTLHYESCAAPIMIFGEAKSFGMDRIDHKEINRLKTFAEKFPGSGIVISMLRRADELTRNEKILLRKLALWGRKYDAKKKQILSPVIILAADELLEHGISARSRLLENVQRYGPSKIHALSMYTQKKYLDIAPKTT